MQDRKIDESILQRQRELDIVLFKEKSEDISKQGFMVTHTGPFDNYVEVGITPFTEENAKYIYSIIGNDKVKVVEGFMATTMMEPTVTDPARDLIPTTDDIVFEFAEGELPYATTVADITTVSDGVEGEMIITRVSEDTLSQAEEKESKNNMIYFLLGGLVVVGGGIGSYLTRKK
ncbi:hypothetical protein EDC18_103104 [Natranaerovirga pectinivora]|uniref:LPXTG-motif cell wall-anchored protein n=1 Tax=Natranaerovirga pectinivora TaxID=682400 RepID=A0A4R3MP77_9FIRM|nr:hypothetical protein [Natranaerovirga pectinivora]TCT15399.1 hypothetical protein EDC18_103104 [Natranaerovirga pectinivora]